jgi:lipopolysaccharide transport system ATP-binding protein
MSKVIIIEGLYKEYKLGVIGRGTLYRDLQSWWAKIRNKEDPNSIIGHQINSNTNKGNVLALKNINLEISKGEVIGIIGANGAGKSTLLKILSGITSPSKGTIKIKGRIASLLEVGTGFHSELTGEENIYLNGAINGMTKKEIFNKLSDIIKFAGVEKFIDTPVKRYSTGMYVRLAFAVAAYLDPDILIVDEVLAVGDRAFQNKALNKMGTVSKSSGRTVLFVSHNMDSIRKLCTKVVILNEGQIIDFGNTEKMINRYLNSSKDIRKNYNIVEWSKNDNGPGGSIVKLKSICTKNSKNIICSDFSINEEIIVEAEFWILKSGYQVLTLFNFSYNNIELFNSFDNYIKQNWGKQKSYEKGLYQARCVIPKNLLNEGTIDTNIVIFLPPGDIESSYQVMYPRGSASALSFNIIDDYDTNSVRGFYPYDWSPYVHIRPKTNFEIKKIEHKL